MRQPSSVARTSKVSSGLLKRIWPDQAAAPFNLAGFDAPERRGIESSFHARFAKRLDSIYFSAEESL